MIDWRKRRSWRKKGRNARPRDYHLMKQMRKAKDKVIFLICQSL
jgi:hypothetical protein